MQKLVYREEFKGNTACRIAAYTCT
ncbi:palindromic element RPE1 domain-containing protein [Candidatus Rickettsia barbariae]